MANYTPPLDDPFAGIMDDDVSVSSFSLQNEEEIQNREIYAKWVDLHPSTKRNLELFEGRGFRLSSQAEGEDQVERLVRASIILISLPSAHTRTARRTE
jgi:hypothetical protein